MPRTAPEWLIPAKAARLAGLSLHEIHVKARKGEIPSRYTPAGHLRVQLPKAMATASSLRNAAAVLAALANAIEPLEHVMLPRLPHEIVHPLVEALGAAPKKETVHA